MIERQSLNVWRQETVCITSDVWRTINEPSLSMCLRSMAGVIVLAYLITYQIVEYNQVGLTRGQSLSDVQVTDENDNVDDKRNLYKSHSLARILHDRGRKLETYLQPLRDIPPLLLALLFTIGSTRM
jgi:hypothetical protein